MSNNEQSADTTAHSSSTTESAKVEPIAEKAEENSPITTQQVENTNASPVVEQPKIIEKNKSKSKFGLFEIIIGAVVVFGGGYAVTNYFDWSPKSLLSNSEEVRGGSVLVVNTDLLVSAITVELMGDEKARERISISIEKVYQEIRTYTENGYVVLDSDTPILHASNSDVTQEIAEKIGVDLKKGLKVAEDNKFIGNAGGATLELKAQEAQEANGPTVIKEDFSELQLSKNANGETLDLDY